jgi:lipoprotein Spr/probable lipoprotein NlpC
MLTKNIVILCIYGCLVSGCGSVERKEANFKEHSSSIISKDNKTSLHSVKNVLYAKYRKWQGVRYQLGGLSKNGIDCSGFVYIIYKSGLGIDLPRTTNLQSRVGKEINRNNLKTGDLIFFKTKNALSHVGIYLENRKFIHASTTKGVTISRLDNIYWKSRYWKSIRI